ncbi:hypothetical protein [Bosea sp. ASV33]|uniref:hypothetical protein n=1 Tax=Bosea sp. ASV33 TaxID=2795106 RepID=UPI0018EB05B9|nr:hypothetical protein [Bosea sp. ASV33]
MSRLLVTTAVLAFAFPIAALAQGRTENVKSGAASRVYNVFSCGRGIVGGVNGTASHGTITTRTARQNRCGRPDQEVTEVVYTSQPGYRGPDEAYVYWSGGRTRVSVNVR